MIKGKIAFVSYVMGGVCVYNGTKKGTHSFYQRCSPWSLYPRYSKGQKRVSKRLFVTSCAGQG